MELVSGADIETGGRAGSRVIGAQEVVEVAPVEQPLPADAADGRPPGGPAPRPPGVPLLDNG